MRAPRSNPSAPALDARAEFVRRVESSALELPLLNDTAARVMSLCGDASCDARQLADLIQRDPSLGGQVLHIANSAAYAARERIVSLQQAVSRLGLATLRDIALAIAVRGKVFDVKGFEADLTALWLHSVGSAAWAKEIARLRRRNVEGAFLCGLLHDVGKPVLLQTALDVVRDGAQAIPRATLHAWLDEFHADVGARLLAHWSMPDWMQVAVRQHHAPEGATGDAAELAATAALADLVAHWSAGDAATSESDIRTSPSLARLSLYPDELDLLLERREQAELAAKAFR